MRRTAVVVAAMLLGTVILLGVLRLSAHGSGAVTGITATATACLRTHGWSLEHVSTGRFVADRGPYKMIVTSRPGTYDLGERAFHWRPGWKHPRLIAKASHTAFACFPMFSVRL
jgi:hypothetical protein